MKKVMSFILFLSPLFLQGQWIKIGYVDNPTEAVITSDGTTYSFNNVEGPTPTSGWDYYLFRNFDTLVLSGHTGYGGEPIGKIFFLNRDTGFVRLNNQVTTLEQTTNAGNTWAYTTCILMTYMTSNFDFMYLQDFNGFSINYKDERSAELRNCINGNLNVTTISGYDFTTGGRIFYLNPDTGFIIARDTSYNSVVMRTSNSSVSWNTVLTDENLHFRSIQFPSQMKGFIVGDSGVVYKTVDNGNTWVKSIIDTLITLYDVSFYNDSCGYISGSSGKLYFTNDAAATWEQVQFPTTEDILQVLFVNDSVGFVITTGSTMSWLGEVYKTTYGGSYGIHENKNHFLNSLSVFPNPGQEYFTISLPIELINKSNLVFEIVSIYGQIIRTQVVSGPKTKLNFRLEGEPTGLYIVKLNNDNDIYYGKFIKE